MSINVKIVPQLDSCLSVFIRRLHVGSQTESGVSSADGSSESSVYLPIFTICLAFGLYFLMFYNVCLNFICIYLLNGIEAYALMHRIMLWSCCPVDCD